MIWSLEIWHLFCPLLPNSFFSKLKQSNWSLYILKKSHYKRSVIICRNHQIFQNLGLEFWSQVLFVLVEMSLWLFVPLIISFSIIFNSKLKEYRNKEIPQENGSFTFAVSISIILKFKEGKDETNYDVKYIEIKGIIYSCCKPDLLKIWKWGHFQYPNVSMK